MRHILTSLQFFRDRIFSAAADAIGFGLVQSDLAFDACARAQELEVDLEAAYGEGDWLREQWTAVEAALHQKELEVTELKAKFSAKAADRSQEIALHKVSSPLACVVGPSHAGLRASPTPPTRATRAAIAASWPLSRAALRAASTPDTRAAVRRRAARCHILSHRRWHAARTRWRGPRRSRRRRRCG